MVCTVRKQGDERWRLTSSPAHQWGVLPSLRLSLLSSAKPSRKYPHRHALSCVSRVTLSPITLTVKMSNDRWRQSFKVNATNLQLAPSPLCAFSFSIHSVSQYYFLPPSISSSSDIVIGPFPSLLSRCFRRGCF